MLGSINILLLLIPFTLAAVIASSISAREVHSGIESKPQEGMEDYFRKAQLDTTEIAEKVVQDEDYCEGGPGDSVRNCVRRGAGRGGPGRERGGTVISSVQASLRGRARG